MKLGIDGKYRITFNEHIQHLVILTCICAGVGWLFFDQILLLFAGLPLYGVFYRSIYQLKNNRYQTQLRLDFKDVMLSIYSSLSAGTTLEESVRRAAEDMKRSLKADSRMIIELDLICKKMERNISIVQCLEEMALRCRNRDIDNFAQILILAKKQGGNMAALVRESVEKIQRRIETTYEIEGIIGAKRNEFLFMCVIPVGVMFYMRIFSAEFMSILYGNLTGVITMTVCLGIYMAAILIGFRILKVENE